MDKMERGGNGRKKTKQKSAIRLLPQNKTGNRHGGLPVAFQVTNATPATAP